MNDLEERLRDALRADAGEADAGPTALAGVRAAGARAVRRRQRLQGGAVAALVVAVLATGAAVVATGDDDGDEVATEGGRPVVSTTATEARGTVPSTVASTTTSSAVVSTETSVTTPPPSTSTTSEPGGAPRPAHAVAVSEANAVVVLDTADGRVVRTLFEAPPQPEGTVAGVSLSADGRTVWFSFRGPSCDSPGAVHRVPIGGGPAEKVADGMSPAVSPDGRLLAYAAPAAARGGPGDCAQALVVRDLVSGVERSWVPEDNGWDELVTIAEISWAPDSRRLAYEGSYEGSGVSVLDTLRPGTLTAAKEPVRVRGHEGSLFAPSWLAAGDRLVVGTWCCYDDPNASSTRVLEVGLADGATVERARPDDLFDDLAVDGSGEHLVYVRGGGEAVMVGRDGTSSRLAGGLVAIDW